MAFIYLFIYLFVDEASDLCFGVVDYLTPVPSNKLEHISHISLTVYLRCADKIAGWLRPEGVWQSKEQQNESYRGLT